MSWLDFLIFGVIAWFAFAGLSAGLLREAVTLAGAVVGLVLAGLLYRQLGDDFGVFTDSERVARIAAFLAIFGAMFLAGQIVAALLKSTASVLMLGPLDHVLGLVFGVLKGLVVVEGLLFLFARYQVDVIRSAMDGSLVTPFFLDGLPVLLHVLPQEFRTAVERFPN